MYVRGTDLRNELIQHGANAHFTGNLKLGIFMLLFERSELHEKNLPVNCPCGNIG